MNSNIQQHSLLWKSNLQTDIDYMRKLVKKSPTTFNLEEFEKTCNEIDNYIKKDGLVTQFFYQQALKLLTNKLQDDHTQIQILSPIFYYCGFFCCLKTFDHEPAIMVAISNEKDIHNGSIIEKINDGCPIQFLQTYISNQCNQQRTQEYNMRQAAASLTLFNPFLEAKNVTIQGKKYKLKYRELKKYEVEKYGGVNQLLTFLTSGSIYYNKIEFQHLRYSGVFSIKLHKFPANQEETEQFLLMMNTYNKVKESIDKVVLDMRQNYGGVRLLISEQAGKWLQQELTETLSLEKEYLEKLYDEIFRPLIHKSNNKSYKDFYQKQMKFYEKMSKKVSKLQEKLYQNPKPIQQPSNRFYKEIAKDVLKNGNQYKKVVLVTDYNCHSACVWTVQFLKMFANVVLIGKDVEKTTGGGIGYKFPLPTQNAQLIMPIYSLKLNEPSVNSKIINSVSPADISLNDFVVTDEHNIIQWVLENKQVIDQALHLKAKRTLEINIDDQ